MINLSPEHVASKKRVGNLEGNPVLEVVTTGGFNMIIVARNGSFETLGTGPHRAVSRFIAEKRESKINWTDLNKGDYVDPSDIEFLVPKYEAVTDQIRAIQGIK